MSTEKWLQRCHSVLSCIVGNVATGFEKEEECVELKKKVISLLRLYQLCSFVPREPLNSKPQFNVTLQQFCSK